MFKQAWWVTLAVVLAGLQTVFAIGTGLDDEASGTTRVTLMVGVTALAVLTVIGISQRQRQRRRGDVMIAVGVIPSVLAGVVAFWFPPMWLVTVAGIAVVASATRDSAVPVELPAP